MSQSLYTPNEIYIELLSWVDPIDDLQNYKNTMNMYELNKKYIAYMKKYLRFRVKVQQAILKDETLYKKTFDAVRDDFLFWILLNAVSYDINRAGSNFDTPFIGVLPFKEQRKFIHALQYDERGVHVQKSRRAGASHFASDHTAWQLETKTGLVLRQTNLSQRTLDAGRDQDGNKKDKGYNSSFEKFRLQLDHSMFTARDWRDIPGNIDQRGLISLNGNEVLGLVMGPLISVGEGIHEIKIDEFDPWAESKPNVSQRVLGALSAAANRVIIYSTYRGADYPHFKIRQEHDTDSWVFITLGWKDNPTCNEAWYKFQCGKMGNNKVLIAQELDMDAAASKEGVIFSSITTQNLIPMQLDMFTDRVRYKAFTGADNGGGMSPKVILHCFLDTHTGKVYVYDMHKSTKSRPHQIRTWTEGNGFLDVEIAIDVAAFSDTSFEGYDQASILQNVAGLKVKAIPNQGIFFTQVAIDMAFEKDMIYINKDKVELVQDLRGYNWKDNKVNKDTHSHTGDAMCYLWRNIYGNISKIEDLGKW